MSAPLGDIRVCDLSQNLAGPFCAQILGDLGAEVVKVEPPGGDSARPWGPPFWGEDSTLFLSSNRNKRSVVVDLKSPDGLEVVHRLAARSDVFLHSSRASVPERLGIDYASIRRRRPDVIYASVSAFGDRGPMVDEPGYDPLVQAFSGMMSLTGHPGGPPARVGGSVVDFGTAMWTAIAVLAALRTRERTGEGAEVTTALMDTALGWISYHLLGHLATGRVPGPLGTALGSIAPYEAFPTTDGQVMIAAGNDRIFRRLCQGLGLESLARDPRFRTNPERVAHREALLPPLKERTRSMTTDGLVAVLRAHEVPCSPIHSVDQVVEDPQVEASGMIVPAEHRDAPDYREVAIPLRIDGVRPRGERRVPGPGEHTREVLEELGYDSGEIDRLVESGAVEVGKG